MKIRTMLAAAALPVAALIATPMAAQAALLNLPTLPPTIAASPAGLHLDLGPALGINLTPAPAGSPGGSPLSSLLIGLGGGNGLGNPGGPGGGGDLGNGGLLDGLGDVLTGGEHNPPPPPPFYGPAPGLHLGWILGALHH